MTLLSSDDFYVQANKVSDVADFLLVADDSLECTAMSGLLETFGRIDPTN